VQKKDTRHKYNHVRKQHTHTHILAVVEVLRGSHHTCCTTWNKMVLLNCSLFMAYLRRFQYLLPN